MYVASSYVRAQQVNWIRFEIRIELERKLIDKLHSSIVWKIFAFSLLPERKLNFNVIVEMKRNGNETFW